MKHKVKIIIPIYKTDFNELEQISLNRSVRVLKDHRFTVVCPENLDLKPLENYFEGVNWETKRFSSHFFKNIEGYNRLMLSEVFYDAFSDVDFILICQTDVFVIKDELDFWCSCDFSYIGAPWIGSPHNFWYNFNNFLKKIVGKKVKSYKHLFKVGNGGFSLRKVKEHQKIVSKHKALINYHQENPSLEKYHVEDVFFSLIVPQLEPDFTIPDWKTALKFCIDRKPKLALKFNQEEFPFAIHGIDKPKVRKFWKPIIKKFILASKR